ncbi:MAG: GWxTD domain-containing protein [Rhodothermales bacterium]|jgi:GWxTD domain-containing protein
MRLGEEWVRQGNLKAAAEAFDEAATWRTDARGLALWASQFGDPAFFRPAQSVRNRARALRLVREDSLDQGANMLLGAQDAAEVARRARRANVPAGMTADMLASRSRSERSLGGGGIRFSDRFRGQNIDLSVSSERREGLLYRTTLRRLRAAAPSVVVGGFALRALSLVHLAGNDYDALADDAARYRRQAPDDELGFFVGALAAVKQGRSDAAAALADMGLALLSERERADILDPGRIMSPTEEPPADVEHWWTEQDPIALTPINERLTEHVARWVYADIRFGDPYKDKLGVETDPGRVVLRYGVPDAETQFTGGDTAAGSAAGLDRYSVLQYGPFDFRFMDLARAGRWSFYSPRSTAFEGGRANSEVRASDYVILARERFRRIPSFIEPYWETQTMEAAVFRGARGTGGYDVLAMGTVPAGLGGGDTGAMVLDDGLRIVSLGMAAVEPWVPENAFLKELRVPVAVSSFFSARIEAVVPNTLEGPARTMVFRSPPVPVPPARGLAVSSLLLADLIEDQDGPGRDGVWIRDGLEITPSADHVFASEAPVYIYFEVYDLTQDAAGLTDFEVTATLSEARDPSRTWLTRLLTGRDDSVGAGFRSTGSEPDTGEYMLIDTQGRGEGDYLLSLEIYDRQSRTKVETSTSIRFR